MEHHVNTAHEQDGSLQIVNSLKYQLPDTASYIIDRKSVTFWGKANDYNPQGIRVIQIEAIGDGYLDPSTLKLMFLFTNESSGTDKTLTPLSASPACLFYRYRCIMGGIHIEDNRNYIMLHHLQPPIKRVNDAVEGFCIDGFYTNDIC